MKDKLPMKSIQTTRRKLLKLGMSIGTTAVAAPYVFAQSLPYPSKPIQIVVPAAPGGSPDILARILGPALAARLGQSVTIDNRAGGAGNIAASLVAKASPDGYTLLIGHDGLAINQTLFEQLPFHPVRSFAPVLQAFNAPQVLAVHADVPARNLKEFLALAKAHPGKYALASPAVGTTGQLGVLLLQSQANVRFNPVVYRSAQPALTDVLGKHAEGIIVTLAPALPFIQEGKLRALAVSTPVRSQVLPDVPTFVEQGLPQFSFSSWQGIVAPVGTSKPVIERLNRELNAVLKEPEVRAAFVRQAFDPVGGTPEEFGRVIASSIDTWAAVIQANNIKLNG